jgi:hypothetical protein
MVADSVNNSNRQPPNPEEFGRKVLWHLCGVRAEMRVMLSMFARSIEQDIKKADEIYVGWITQALATQEKLYKEALEMVGIPKPKG